MVQPAAPADFPVVRTLQTRWSDNDTNGHMNNAVFYELFDTLINSWLAEYPPCSSREDEAAPALPVVAEQHCRFVAELAFPGEVLGALRVQRIGHNSVTYEVALFNAPRDGRSPILSATCTWVHVYLDSTARRPTPIPLHLRTLLQSIGP